MSKEKKLQYTCNICNKKYKEFDNSGYTLDVNKLNVEFKGSICDDCVGAVHGAILETIYKIKNIS